MTKQRLKFRDGPVPGTELERLLAAVQTGDLKTFSALLPALENVNDALWMSRTALHEAAAHEHPRIVEHLLTVGADPNLPDINGITPLMEAASGGDVVTMKLLLEAGASPTLRDKFGSTASDYAQAQRQAAAVRLLQDRLRLSSAASPARRRR